MMIVQLPPLSKTTVAKATSSNSPLLTKHTNLASSFATNATSKFLTEPNFTIVKNVKKITASDAQKRENK